MKGILLIRLGPDAVTLFAVPKELIPALDAMGQTERTEFGAWWRPPKPQLASYRGFRRYIADGSVPGWGIVNDQISRKEP